VKAKPKSRILWKNTLLGFRRFALAVTICPRSPRPAAPLPPTPQHPEPGVLRHFLTLPLSQRSRSHELFYYSQRPPPVPPHRAATSTQAPDRHRRAAPAAAAATAPRVRVPSSSEVLPLETRHEKSRQEKNPLRAHQPPRRKPARTRAAWGRPSRDTEHSGAPFLPPRRSPLHRAAGRDTAHFSPNQEFLWFSLAITTLSVF